MTQEQIITRLQAGNARYMADQNERKLQDLDRRAALTAGQDPYAIILSCADSRVVPELAFDAGLGELFVVRVAGNVANSSSIASIEYAVANIGSPVIVVLGHESCGAVTAAFAGGDNGYNLNHLLAHISPALHAAEEGASVNEIVKVNAEKNAEELVNRSAIIRGAVDSGKLKIVPAYYNLESGKIDFL
ncbi:MAG: carbonic anhydrase [Bacteroidota bacterium]